MKLGQVAFGIVIYFIGRAGAWRHRHAAGAWDAIARDAWERRQEHEEVGAHFARMGDHYGAEVAAEAPFLVAPRCGAHACGTDLDPIHDVSGHLRTAPRVVVAVPNPRKGQPS